MLPGGPKISVKPRTSKRLPAIEPTSDALTICGQAFRHGEDRDDQLWRITERRVQETADTRTGVEREVVRCLADQPRQRDQRRRGEHEHRQVAGSVEPIQDNRERRQQQRYE